MRSLRDAELPPHFLLTQLMDAPLREHEVPRSFHALRPQSRSHAMAAGRQLDLVAEFLGHIRALGNSCPRISSSTSNVDASVWNF